MFKSKYELGSAKGAISKEVIDKFMEQYPLFREFHRDFVWQDYPMKKYDVRDETKKDLEKRFTYHPPINDQAERYVLLRDKAKELAYLTVELSPYSREQSVALTHLDQFVMNVNAAIARNE